MQKNAVYLSLLLSGISVGIISGLILDILDEPLMLSDVMILVFSIPINAVLLVIFALPAIFYLRSITRSLASLNDGKVVEAIQPLPLGVFSELTEEVNRIIDDHQQYQMARGQLYEQISEVAAQEERKRLARDLHDSIKQQVFSISISAAAADAHLKNNPEAARAALLDVRQSAQEAMVEMRALLQQLSPAPLEKSGLIEALREQSEALSYRTGAIVKTHFGVLPSDEQFPLGTQAVIFRIAQEALSNIARHARAKQVDLTLEVDSEEHVILEISDDGQGFDVATITSGMGLNNMKSRAESIQAQFNLTSHPNGGTKLTISIPFMKQTVEVINMFEIVEDERKAVINRYWLFAGTAAMTIAAASLLLWRVVNRADDFFADRITQVILLILVAILVIGIPLLFVIGRLAYRETHALLISVQHDYRTRSWLQRHRYMMHIIIALVAAILVPLTAITPDAPTPIPLIVAIVLFGIVVWFYSQMYRVYRDEVQQMAVSDQIDEMTLRLGELRTGWGTVVLLLIVQLVTLNFGDPIAIPPQEADHWITFSLSIIAIALLANQIISLWVYRQWRTQAQRERIIT